MRNCFWIAALASCTDNHQVTDACRALDATVLVSTEALPFGENQQGTVFHPWYLSLDGGAVDWRHDDTVHDRGTYACVGLSISATFSGAMVEGSFDPMTGVLTWAGEDYVSCADKLQCEHEAGWQSDRARGVTADARARARLQYRDQP